MEAEALPIISGLGLTRDAPPLLPPPAPATTFSGKIRKGKEGDGGGGSSEISVHVVCSGKCKVHGVDNIGTVPAALMTYLALSELSKGSGGGDSAAPSAAASSSSTPASSPSPSVDLVISAGTAGGFRSRGAEIGDVYCATAFANHDRRIPLPKFDGYGVWKCDAHPAPRMVEELQLKTGAVSTGNSLDWHELDMTAMNASEASVKEMEASGVAWACSLHGVPLLALKAVTDIVDGGKAAEEEFLANLEKASEALHFALKGALEFLVGKSVDEL